MMAGVVMENYDPQFGSLTSSGDVVVGGFNFGTGSSREQAVTALKCKGIPLVIAGSFSKPIFGTPSTMVSCVSSRRSWSTGYARASRTGCV